MSLVAWGKFSAEPDPRRNWISHSVRVLGTIDNQVRSLRKRQVIESFTKPDGRKGTYWGIRTNIANYELSDALNCPWEKTLRLADLPTRLKQIDGVDQERLINWGYAVCDAAIGVTCQKKLRCAAPPPLPGSLTGTGMLSNRKLNAAYKCSYEYQKQVIIPFAERFSLLFFSTVFE